MKKITLALVGLSISSAAFADPRVAVTCFEDIKGAHHTVTSSTKIFAAEMTAGKVIFPSSAKPDHEYILTVFTGKKSCKTGAATILSGGPIAYAATAPQTNCQSQGQGQGQFTDQGQCTEQTQAQTQGPGKAIILPAPAPVAMPEQGQCGEQTQAQGQCQTTVQAPICTGEQQSPCVGQAQDQTPCMDQTQTQGQTQGKFGTGSAVCGNDGTACMAETSKLNIKLENKFKFGDVKHSRKGEVTLGNTTGVGFHYHPGIMQYVHGVEISCSIQYLGNF